MLCELICSALLQAEGVAVHGVEMLQRWQAEQE